MAALSAIALVAWVITVTWANDMGNMPGTMGMGVVEFVAMWTLMMSAMMLPSVAPMSFLYSRTITTKRKAHSGTPNPGNSVPATSVNNQARAR